MTNAKTRKGKVVNLRKTTRVNGGWISYVLDAQGYAAEVFIPE